MAEAETLKAFQSGDPLWKTGDDFIGAQGAVFDEWTNEERIPLDLHTAASVGHEDNVRTTLKLKSKDDLNKKNKGGWTPLMYAAYCGHSSVALLLIQEGANVNSKNLRGHTSLMLSAMCGNSSSILILLQHGAQTEMKDLQGWTALFHATSSGHQNVIHLLANKGANISAVEQTKGLTPLMIASAAGHEMIVKDLLQLGANPVAKSSKGETARSLAAMKGHCKVVAAIDQFTSSNINCVQDGGKFLDHLYAIESPLIRPSQPQHAFNGNIIAPGIVTSIQPSSPHLHGVADLQNLLDILGLTKYYGVFQKQNIDLPIFLTLSDKDLKDIGIELLGPRRKMTSAISRWHSNGLLIGNPLEQVYANKMQIENGELQKRLSEINVKLLQERDLRSFAEQCLNEERYMKKTYMEKIHKISQHLNALADKLKGATVNMQQILYPNMQYTNPAVHYSWQVSSDSSVTRAMIDLINFVDSVTIEISGQTAMLLHSTGRQQQRHVIVNDSELET